MDKFNYRTGDIFISNKQCEGCIYRIKDVETKCDKFEHKPKEIINLEKACPFFELKGKVKL